MIRDEEEAALRALALQNATTVLVARQQIERELAGSLTMMRAVLEATTDGLLVTDLEGTITCFNQRYVQMWGHEQQVLATKDHRVLAAASSLAFPDPPAYVARVEEIYATAPQETSDVLTLSDGRIFERFSRLQLVDGQAVGRVWSFRDITERRRAEQALHEETRVLELLNRTGALLASQLDLHELLQVITDSARELSGGEMGVLFYSAGDEGRSFSLHALSGLSREAFERLGLPEGTPLFAPVFEGRGVVRTDDVTGDPRYGPPAGGSLAAIRSYLAVPIVLRSGIVVGGIFLGHRAPGVFTDRSERLVSGVASQAAVAIESARLYESERAARAQAERASQMKDEFLATISHELRTPLNAVLGWAQVLRGQESGPELQKGLEAIERNARVQTRLIEDLLDMSRIISGKLRLDWQQVDPVAVIEAALETMRPAAETRGVRLERHLARDAGLISGDPGRLQQVVWNLVSNAVKFTPRGGRVRVTLHRAAAQVEVRVVDTGMGIRPEFLPHVFDRFRQQDGSPTRAQGGLGIGLALVKHIVELHGGTIRLESPGDGQGSTAVLRLPVRAARTGGPLESGFAADPAALAEPFRAADLSGLTVLVVDDEADARELLRHILTDCRATVLTAATAEEAVALVEQRRPDVLVSDIGMPRVDGYELLRRVRALGRERGGRLPAIALTAFARSEDRTRALLSGYNVHVAKPVEPRELVATVASVAGRTGD